MTHSEFSRLLHSIIEQKEISVSSCILFGSQARKEATAESDFDVLLIVPDDLSFNQKAAISRTIRIFFAQRHIPVDIIVKSERESEKYREIPGSIVRHALLEGYPV